MAFLLKVFSSLMKGINIFEKVAIKQYIFPMKIYSILYFPYCVRQSRMGLHREKEPTTIVHHTLSYISIETT